MLEKLKHIRHRYYVKRRKKRRQRIEIRALVYNNRK